MFLSLYDQPMENYSFRTFTSYPESSESSVFRHDSRLILACFDRRPIRHDSSHIGPVWHESKPSQCESVKKKKKKKKSSNAQAATSKSIATPSQPRPCFIGIMTLWQLQKNSIFFENRFSFTPKQFYNLRIDFHHLISKPMSWDVECISEGKFLGTLGIQKNAAPSSYIHGEFHHEFNE